MEPLAFLAQHPDDYRISVAVLNRAQKMRQDYDRGMADYVANKTAGLTARSITRWIARSFRKK